MSKKNLFSVVLHRRKIMTWHVEGNITRHDKEYKYTENRHYVS